MRFLIFFGTLILIIGLLKVYVFRGVNQALLSDKWMWIYAILSISITVISLVTMFASYSGGMMGLTPFRSFVIGIGVSLVICEMLLSALFLIDDVVMGGEWLYALTQKSQAQEPLPESRRRFLKTLSFGLMSIPFGAYLYGITKGKYDFRVLEEELTFTDLPEAFDGFRILQFSDMHSGSFDRADEVKRGMELMQAQKADLILFTGDLVNGLQEEALPYISMLKNLSAPFGKYSVLGNHDYPSSRALADPSSPGYKNFVAIKQHHADSDFFLLNNENVKLEKEGASIRLIGVENWGTSFIKAGDFDKAIEGCEEDEFSILMSHDPSHWEEKIINHPKHVHLTLAGHTHGMQMGVEVAGIKWSPVKYRYKRWAGLYEELNQYLYVNRGFGFIAFPGRVGMPPEITVFTLRKA
ncbi:MAG: metallophosphoesterase [Bacteroidota bacterium]